MKFPPINLWSVPRQPELEKKISLQKFRLMNAENRIESSEGIIRYQEDIIDDELTIIESAEDRIKEYRFIYYLRTGRFPD